MLEIGFYAWLLSIFGIAAWEGFKLDRKYRDQAHNGEFDD